MPASQNASNNYFLSGNQFSDMTWQQIQTTILMQTQPKDLKRRMMQAKPVSDPHAIRRASRRLLQVRSFAACSGDGWAHTHQTSHLSHTLHAGGRLEERAGVGHTQPGRVRLLLGICCHECD